MFEMIGLLIATAIFFALAAVVSAILAASIWIFARKKEGPRVRLVVAAALIPLLSATYMWLCIALLPSESLFGDISEPLPNGYMLTALGKMPDYGHIDSPKSRYSSDVPSGYVGKLAVYGQFVVGQYSHPFNGLDTKPTEAFFFLNTSNGSTIDLPTRVELENKLGHPVTLTEVQFFRSQERSYRIQQNINSVITFSPPMIALGILIVFVLRLRSRTLPPSPNIYT
jgi:hypothetical protein